MTETLVRPVTHTPTELRRDLATIASYGSYFPGQGESWGGQHSWWEDADSAAPILRGSGLTSRLIEAAHFENDWHDALIENQAHERVGTFSIGVLSDEPEEDWTQIDGEIHAEFPGPIQDQKLAKLRELAKERQNLRRRVVELETERHAEITDGKDPRITGLLVLAAEEANNRGYCEVYDAIANTAGFPTRQELQELGHLTHTYSVETLVTFGNQWVTVEVEAANPQEAMEVVRNWNTSDLSEYLDESPQVRWSPSSASVNN